MVSLYVDIKVSPQPTEPPPPPVDWPDLWQVLHDIERPAEEAWLAQRLLPEPLQPFAAFMPKILWRKNVPEVYLAEPVHKMVYVEWLQHLAFDMFGYFAPHTDRALQIKHWRSTYGCHRALNNYAGFDCRYPEWRGGPHGPFRDYISRIDLSESFPKFDKIRFFGGATLGGEEDGDWVWIETITQPTTLAYVLEHPWLMQHATTVREDGSIGMFPQGDGYPVVVPVISEKRVKYPKKYLRRVSKIMDPYTIYSS